MQTHTVTITTSTPNVKIYYTTNASQLPQLVKEDFIFPKVADRRGSLVEKLPSFNQIIRAWYNSDYDRAMKVVRD